MNWKIRIRQYIKMAAQQCLLPAVYALHRGRAADPKLVLLADAHHDQCPYSMEAVRDALLARGELRVEEYYLDYQRAGAFRVFREMLSFMRAYAGAGTVILCDNFLPAAGCRKRKETMVVQLWHACGCLKRFGYDTTDDIPGMYRGHVFRNTDLVTVSAPVCAAPFASAMRLDAEKVRPLGVSRTDRYFDPIWRERKREEFYRACPEARGKYLVLWAPTFRGNPGAPDCITLDLDELSAQLGEEYLLAAKLHPHMAEAGGKWDLSGFSTEELFPAVDLLIADYSSLIYEYLLFGKPLILYTPDYADYQKRRGFYMDYGKIPGIRISREEDLAAAVRAAAEGKRAEEKITEDKGTEEKTERNKGAEEKTAKGSETEKRDAFLHTYMGRCDGHATERIMEVILAHIGALEEKR